MLDTSGINMPPLESDSSVQRLTKLRLHKLCLQRDFEKHLNSGLPVLQDLVIRGIDMTKISRITSHSSRISVLITRTHPRRNRHLISPCCTSSFSFVASLFSLSLYVGWFLLSQHPSISWTSLKFGRYMEDDKDLLTTLCKLRRSHPSPVTWSCRASEIWCALHFNLQTSKLNCIINDFDPFKSGYASDLNIGGSGETYTPIPAGCIKLRRG